MATPYRDNMPFTIDQVVGELRLTVKRQTPKEWTVNCPFCLGRNNLPDTHGHMSVDLNYDRYRCYRCGRNGGKLDLYAEMRGIDTKAAYKELKDILVGDVGRVPRPTRKPVPIPTVESDERASCEALDNTYRNLMDMLTLTPKHREDLQRRGLPDAEIDRLGYKSVPAVGHRRLASQLLKKECELEGVPGFFVDENGQWRLNIWLTGIMMPSLSIDGRIQGIQVRKDDPGANASAWEKEHFKKCYWLTGKNKPSGTRVITEMHFSNPSRTVDTLGLTEGLMKSDIAAYLGTSFFSALPGVSHYDALRRGLASLKQNGYENIKKVAVAWDMDQHENTQVKESLNSIRDIILEAKLKPILLSWPEKKGIDDYLLWKKQTK